MNIQAIIDDMLQSKEVAKAKEVQDKVSENDNDKNTGRGVMDDKNKTMSE